MRRTQYPVWRGGTGCFCRWYCSENPGVSAATKHEVSRLLPLCSTSPLGGAPGSARLQPGAPSTLALHTVTRPSMPGRLCGWHTIIRGKQTREVHTVVRLLLGILGLLMCVAGCAGPNPFVRARPPDALAWEEARRADSAYFYQRFLTQYPTSDLCAPRPHPS